MEVYHKIGTFRRTVLRRMPLGLVDIQALPPRGWCVRCGAEVYRRGQDRCNRCRARGEGIMDNEQWTMDNFCMSF